MAGASVSARGSIRSPRAIRRDVDLDDLADMLSAIADGGIILGRVTRDKEALPRQVMLYRDFVRAVFTES